MGHPPDETKQAKHALHDLARLLGVGRDAAPSQWVDRHYSWVVPALCALWWLVGFACGVLWWRL